MDLDGRPDRWWRGRNKQRDTAFCQSIYGNGLRVAEWASVVIPELPPYDRRRHYYACHLSGACAKGGYGHPYWTPQNAMKGVAMSASRGCAWSLPFTGPSSVILESDRGLHGDSREVGAEDHTTALALLDERRVTLAQARVRTVNQLPALMRDLLPGGAPAQLSADQAATLLRAVRPAGDVEKVRTDLARDLVAEIRTLDKRLTENRACMQALVEAADSTLMSTPGIGPVMAVRLIGRVGRASRFPTAAAFANYADAAPVEIASADKARHRLSRSGDRQLNSVLHTIAVVQIRMPNSPGHAYYQRKLSEGKTAKEAKRCLKRRLADHVWRVMLGDERRIKCRLTATA
ncbi:transposase [Streptomyces europaeiscabiei]|uniref:Transposase n=1 Tax=Streptomyces europaeiscabiei TaxID=146819 RepID=A0AAJ2PM02_9ACTN|nr:transposase [Streptomyces europaeiscabiei]MDX3129918.1 transposase [Streptomyces europaeiscabiei]